MKEVKVEDHLTARIEALGGLCEKHVSPGRRGPPDRLITWPWGKMRLVETKRPGVTKLRIEQERDHKRRRARGVNVFVLNEKVLVDDWIESELRRAKERGLWCQ